VKRAGLRLYTIHLPAPYSARGAEPQALREGFCLTAFLLTVPWALANRLWIRAGVLSAVIGVFLGIGTVADLNVPGFAVIALAVMAWVGMEANDWLRAGWARRGWREGGVLAAENADTALRRYGDLVSLTPPVAPGDAVPAPSLEGPASA
jgi:hypothetical protein